MGRAWFWWLLLGLVTAGIVVKQHALRSRMAAAGFGGGTPLELNCRYAVGVGEFLPAGSLGRAKAIADMVRSLDDTARNDRDRARIVPVVAELHGAEAAVERIDGLLVDGSDAAAELSLLRRQYAGGSLEEFERERLAARLGWSGALAATFGKDNRDAERRRVMAVAGRTFVVLAGATVVVFVAFAIGIVLFVIACVKFRRKTLAWAYRPPPAAAADIVWLQCVVLFLAVLLGLEVVPAAFGVSIGGAFRYAMWGIALLLFYPVWRGARWSAWREDTGWHRGRGVFREIGAGVVGYLACVPIVAVGFLATFLLSRLTREQLSHPIFEEPYSGSRTAYVFGLYLAASVWAPLVEETLFRGALYRYLRGRCSGWVAVPLVGVVFAAVHPQGYAAIPALASIGASFALLRQWRGSLIAPVAAHALHNGALVTLVVTLL